jgi:hypothetical protein
MIHAGLWRRFSIAYENRADETNTGFLPSWVPEYRRSEAVTFPLPWSPTNFDTADGFPGQTLILIKDAPFTIGVRANLVG